MVVKAMFRGADGSMGFRHGREYNLRIYSGWWGRINIYSTDKGESCVYSNAVKFLENWTNVCPV